MRKNEMITIKCIKANRIYNDYSEDMLESLNINLTNNFLFRMFYRYRNIKMEQHNYCEDLIKVELSKNEEQAKKQTKVEFNGITYIPLVTSPSLMKFEEGKYKCSYIYINKEYKEFIDIFKTCVSLEKINDKVNNLDEEICINKDIIARLSLALSGSYRVNCKPNIVVLKEKTYEYTSRYVSFNEEYKLVPVTDNPKDKTVTTYTKTHTFADGAGFMSPKLAEIIQKQLKVNYPIDFAVIRNYCGLAVKGLVVKADFNQYFKDNYVKDTDTFKIAENGDFWVLDRWGQLQNISQADLILNETQVKWAKWFNSMEEVEELILYNYYDNYRDLLTSLYVTKINKKEPKEYTKTNYQLISNLALTPSELRELSEPTENYFKDITSNNPNIDKVRIFLGDTMNQDLTDLEDLEEDKPINEELSAATKIHYLIQSNPSILKTAGVMQVIKSLCKKQVSQIAGGRFYLRGNYKILAPEPVAYLNWIMTNELTGVLKEREFYVPNETGKRTLSRNPLNSFSEIQKINLVKNETLDKYFGNLTSEVLFLNAVDDTAMLMSGADEDGDMGLCIDNDIIYNSVAPKYKIDSLTYDYINLADGDSVTDIVYNEKTEFESAIEGSGNLIGSISNLGMIVTNTSQEFTYLNVLTGDFVTYSQLLNAFIKKYGDRKEYKSIKENIKTWEKLLESNLTKESRRKTKKELKEFKNELDSAYRENLNKKIEELIEEDKVKALKDMSDAEIKQQFINQFHKNAEFSYYALYLQMLAIDSPKTGLAQEAKEKAKDFKEWVKDSFGTTKKPKFIFYSKAENFDSKEAKENAKYSYNKSHSLLNKNIGQVYNNVIDVNKKFNWERLEQYFKMLLFNNPTNVLNSTLLIALESIRDNWKADREKFEEYKKINGEKIYEFRNKYDYKDHDRSNYYNLIDLKYTKKVDELLEEYSVNEIAFHLTQIELKSSKFITNCCWTILKSKVDEQFKNVYKYNIDANGEIDWLFKKYTRILVNRESGDSITTNLVKRAEKFQTRKIKFKLEVEENDMDLSSVIFKKNNGTIEVYDNNGLMCGNVYKDHVKKCVYDKKVEIIKNTIKESTKKTGETYKYVELECNFKITDEIAS